MYIGSPSILYIFCNPIHINISLFRYTSISTFSSQNPRTIENYIARENNGFKLNDKAWEKKKNSGPTKTTTTWRRKLVCLTFKNFKICLFVTWGLKSRNLRIQREKQYNFKYHTGAVSLWLNAYHVKVWMTIIQIFHHFMSLDIFSIFFFSFFSIKILIRGYNIGKSYFELKKIPHFLRKHIFYE